MLQLLFFLYLASFFIDEGMGLHAYNLSKTSPFLEADIL